MAHGERLDNPEFLKELSGLTLIEKNRFEDVLYSCDCEGDQMTVMHCPAGN